MRTEISCCGEACATLEKGVAYCLINPAGWCEPYTMKIINYKQLIMQNSVYYILSIYLYVEKGRKIHPICAIFAMDVRNTIGQIKLNISFVIVVVVASTPRFLLLLYVFVCKSFCPSGKLSSDEKDCYFHLFSNFQRQIFTVEFLLLALIFFFLMCLL